MSLPSAAEVLSWAIRSARSGDVELARIHLDIARELREGSRPALADGAALDFRHPTSASAPPATTRSDLREGETTALSERASRVRPGIAETVVIKRPEWNVGDRALCEHCDEQIYVFAEPVQIGNTMHHGLKQWRHVLTEQVVCPRPPTDAAGNESYVSGSHTFAEPHIPG